MPPLEAFPIIPITDDLIVQDEPMGSKDKFWCQLPDNAAGGDSSKPHRACLGGFGPLHYAEDRSRGGVVQKPASIEASSKGAGRQEGRPLMNTNPTELASVDSGLCTTRRIEVAAA